MKASFDVLFLLMCSLQLFDMALMLNSLSHPFGLGKKSKLETGRSPEKVG